MVAGSIVLARRCATRRRTNNVHASRLDLRATLSSVRALGAGSLCCLFVVACTGASGGSGEPEADAVADGPKAETGADADAGADSQKPIDAHGDSPASDATSGGGKLGKWTLSGPTAALRTNPTVNFRGVDAAYDPTTHTFLVVYGNAPIGGAFIDDDGKQIGDGFRITDAAYDGSNWSQLPRVAAADGGFVVTWHQSRGTDVVTEARRLHFDGTGPAFDGPSTDVATGANQESPAALAFSPASHELLVTWANAAGAHAHRIGADTSLKGGAFDVSTPGQWGEQPSVVFAPSASAFFVLWAQADTTARVGMARIADGTGAIIAAPADLTGDVSFSKVTDLAFDPGEGGPGEVIASWYAATSAATGFFALRLAADGTPKGTPTQIFAPYGSYDGYDLTYSPVSGTSLTAFHASSLDDMGGELDRALATGPVSAVTATGAKSGTFLPRIVAHPTKPFWLVAASPDYAGVSVQRIDWTAP